MWSPKSKKVKRELSFDSHDKGHVHDDDDDNDKMTIMITRMLVTIIMTPIIPYHQKGKKSNSMKQ